MSGKPTLTGKGYAVRDAEVRISKRGTKYVLMRQMTAREVVNYPSNDLLILGTVAIQVGDEIWVG